MNLTVACVFVKGHVPFTPEYVVRLQSMVAKNLARPHKFICLTDRTWMFDPAVVECVQIPAPENDVFGWWSKLNLFNPVVRSLQSGLCLYLDLDVLITDKLDEIVDCFHEYPTDKPAMMLIPDGAPNFHGKGARKTVKLFNSSVVVWKGGEFNWLYERFKKEVTYKLWGDQDWIGMHVPNAGMFPLEWFPRLSACLDGPPDSAKVVLCKTPKNHLAVHTVPWVKEWWV